MPETHRTMTRSVLNDIYFEMIQLVNCVTALLIKHPDLTNISLLRQTILNALLESYLLHSRNLVHFFGNERVNDEILSKDYGFPYRTDLIGEKLQIGIDQDLSHLIGEQPRHRIAGYEWNSMDSKPLLTAVQEFIEFTLQNKLNDADKSEIRKWEELLRGIDMILHLLQQA